MSDFEDFQRDDRIRFLTRHGVLIPAPEGHRKKNVLSYTDVWRTGTVKLATAAALTVECDMPNPLGHRAVIRKATWEKRQVSKL